MKSLLLPLVACAALAGCADYGTTAYGSYPAYGTAAYGNYPAYQGYPAYPGYSAYPAYPYDGYAYGWPGGFYGAPALGVTIQGERFRDGHRGDRDWRGGDRDWHGGHGRTAGAPHRDPDTNALGAGPGRRDRDHGGRWSGRGNDGDRTVHGDRPPRERPQ